MTPTEEANLAIVTEYLHALERGASGSLLAAFFTPDAIQQELPNKLNPTGQTSDLTRILERSERGQHLFSAQEYRITSAIARGNAVALEAEWIGTLAVTIAAIPPGGQMRAHFAIFFECEDGRIRRQRDYDSFEPW